MKNCLFYRKHDVFVKFIQMPQKVANKKIYIDRGVNIFCRTTQILYLFELYIGGPTNDHIVLYLIALKRKSIDKYVPFQIIY